MTEEEKYDRWERFAKLLYQDCLRASRESRKQTQKLKLLLEAKRRYEAAQTAKDEQPEDPDTNDKLLKAMQILKQAYDELTR